MVSEFDAKAREIRGRFMTKTSGHLAQIKAMCGLLNGPAPAEALEELHQISHALAGSAATFGFKAIGEAANALEAQIIAQRSARSVDRDALTSACNRLLDTIQDSFRDASPAADEA